MKIVLNILLFFLFVFSAYSQCPFEAFSKDINSGSEFENYVNENGLDGWEVLYLLGKSNSERNNVTVLTKLDDYIVDFNKAPKSLVEDIKNVGGYDTWVKSLANGVGSDLYKSLSSVLKSSYDDLITKGLRVIEEGSIIKFTDNAGNELAKIVDNEFIPTKWTAYYKGEIVSKTETGHWLIKNGDEYGFDLGYKDGRVLTSEQVNTYHKGIGNHSPYKPLNNVFERDLQVGDKIYIVEYKYILGTEDIAPNPGGWGSKNKISTIKELREDLSVLEGWKDASQNGGLVVREYSVKKLLPVRDGVVGPLQEVGDMVTAPIYRGGEQQYEFMEYLGNDNWKQFLEISDRVGKSLK